MKESTVQNIAVPHLLWDGPDTARATLVLAHGAGQPMDSPFMESIVTGVAAEGIRVGRFEFPYMAKRRVTGRKSGPDRAPILCDAWRRVVSDSDSEVLFVGGKSMGGRIASMIADEVEATGLVCLGYPFHPPGKPEKLRTEHLADLRTPAIFCQGERDTFGTRAEVAAFYLSSKIEFEWMPDGDHSFKPRKKSGFTYEQNMAVAIESVAAFVNASVK